MPELVIIPTTVEHIRMLVADLRDDDRIEVNKMGLSPFKGIWRSYQHALSCHTGFINGRIAAIFGISGSLVGYIGNPWVMTSKVVDEYPFVFALAYRREVKKMLQRYAVLESWVDAEHAKSIKLMEILGFKQCEAKPLKDGAMLRRMEIRA